MRAQVESDFDPVSISCGYRVSCAKALLVDGFLARWAVRGRRCLMRASGVRLGAPDFLAMSERFAGKVHHI